MLEEKVPLDPKGHPQKEKNYLRDESESFNQLRKRMDLCSSEHDITKKKKMSQE
jgi:hypothetical protein